MNRITKDIFGIHEGKEILRFTLENAKRNRVSVINYGGTITSWIINEAGGKKRNIVAGSDNLQEYINDSAYFGCIAGRYANRIARGHFSINGTNYVLACNDGKNHLHGGDRGFDKKIWDAVIIEKDIPVLSLSYFSRDGEEGYPGNLEVTAEFSYTDDDELIIGYSASTDKPTPVNLTSHCYFNLSGDVEMPVLDHSLQLNADSYTPLNEDQIPTGEVIPVAATAFDFRNPAPIKDMLARSEEEYDHNFVLNKNGTAFSFAALLAGPSGSPQLSVFTTEPGLQLYTGNLLNGSFTNRDGKAVNKYGALCLETQHFPDSPNHPQFPSTILQPGKKYSSKSVYKITMK
ncbi:MAG TPA: aldose epimerase family protein [Ferruginibacter sp.]|nr:aldose epimerase family protein [Ferruginibacter sp.]